VLPPEPEPQPEPQPEPDPNPNWDSGSNSGGGYGGSSTPVSTPTTPATPANDSIMINGKPMDVPIGADGALRLKFSDSDIQNYQDNSGECNIEVKNHTNIMMFVSISALETDDLRIQTDFGVLFIPSKTLAAIKATHGDMLRLVIKRGSLYVMLLDENENEIPYGDFENPLTLVLPYELRSMEESGQVVAYNENGKILPFAVYRNGTITFDIMMTGSYDVTHVSKVFTDVSNHWAKEYIGFVAARALYSGDGSGAFDPNSPMTRAMFAQVLANLDGADLSVYRVSRFSDVPVSQWYFAAVEWAAEQGIVSGKGGGLFDPNAPVTREQMAIMLNNYITYKGFTHETYSTPEVFADEASVSSWALEAVRAIQTWGIIGGRPGNFYDPSATATRAEVAAVFARFIDTVAA
jgi:hypothetical protein